MAIVGPRARSRARSRAALVFLLVAFLASSLPVQAQGPGAPATATGLTPTVRHAAKHDELPSLRDARPIELKKSTLHEAMPIRPLPKADGNVKGKYGPSGQLSPKEQARRQADFDRARTLRALGETVAPAAAPTPAAPVRPGMPAFNVNFEGIGNVDFVLPPDTNGDIGPNHYMEWVNLSFQVYDRSGVPQLPTPAAPHPMPGNSLWAGFGGICENTNDGDPIVQYDHLAQRWMVGQFALFGADGHHQCIAVSETDDPTGAWFRYDFLISATKINDYPKFGVWPDAYYMSINQFDANTFAYAGAGAVAFERDAMLQGLDARMVYFDLFDVDPRFGGQLPSDLDGLTLPPAGAPNVFAEADDDAFGFATDRVSLWDFHVDWSDPSLSTFGVGGQPNVSLDTNAFDMELCGFDRSCIPQPGTSQGLDAISDRLMYRLQYRNFGDRQTLVANHTVDVDGTSHAGIRWYILEDTGTGWGIADEGDYAPDGDHRWMGSAALDASGNLALGFSVSGTETFPSIRTAGRLTLDPPGTLPQPEGELMTGTGSQTHPAARWGDYSMMAVDAADDCTFWYTQQYLTETSEADWHTRIASFKFPSCTTGPRGTIEGTVTSSADGPIAGAFVTTGDLSTVTDSSGHYAILVPAETYTVSASAYGFGVQSVPGIVVGDGAEVTQNFVLDPLPEVVVGGTVTDSVHGWPLYARVAVGGAPIAPIYTNPETGQYQVTLFQQTEYQFKVHAVVGSYQDEVRVVTESAATATEDFALDVDPDVCIAPGYRVDIQGLSESFPTTTRPAGWAVIDEIGGAGTWRFDDPAGRGNLTGGGTRFAMIDSDFLGPEASQDTILMTPRVNLSGVGSPSIIFRTDLFHFAENDAQQGPEIADVDLSIDNGDTWTTVWHQDGSLRGPRLESIPVPAAANQANVRVRFHYYNAQFEWWWEVDDVVVGTRDCVPVDGGLVFGQVTDANTADAINDATVSGPGGVSTTTFPTPQDDAQPDGLYLLSAQAGTNDFTASKSGYGSDTESVTVVADALVRQDFTLTAGLLTVTTDPDPLEATLAIGGTGDGTLTLHNGGGADVNFELRERDGGRDILAPKGAPLRVTKGHFSPSRLPDGKVVQPRPRKVVHPPLAPPWEDRADYPTPIMDNTAATLDGLVYSVGGIDGLDITSAGYVYDPGSNAWNPIASMGAAREKPAAAFVGSLLYVVGGWEPTGIPAGQLEVYDPAADTWTNASPVPVAYAAATAVSLDDQLYVIGGCGAFSCGVTDVFKYDPAAEAWSSVASYPEPTSWASCGPIDGKIYCAGGVSDEFGESTSGFVYDPAADAWSPIAPLPQTAWGSGYIATQDQLIISGGVTDNFATVTNEGFAYDVAGDSWSAIPNSNNTVYRGGSACGFYKIGGSIAGFSPIPAVELLDGLNDCGGGADVPWLSENPVSGLVVPGADAPVNVHFDATVPEVDQPGDYFAFLSVKEDTPYTVPSIPVTLHVTVPAGWGEVTGTISGTERCDAPSGPLAGATVEIVAGGTSSITLKTDANGEFERWLPAADGPVSLTISKPGYVGQTVSGVVISPTGGTTTVDRELRLDVPCATVDPTEFVFNVASGGSDSGILTLGNLGPASYDFVIDEAPFDLGPSAVTPLLPATRTFKTPAQIGPLSIRSIHRTPRRAAAPRPALPPWLGAAAIPGGAVRYAHAQCDGDTDRFYVITGIDANFSVSTRTQRFDATTNSWTTLAPIPQGSEGATGVCYAGRIHVFGGDGTDMHWVYNIASDSWSAGAPVPRTVVGGAAAGFAGKIYLAGGAAFFDPSGTTDQVDIYDIASDGWSGTASPMAHGTSFGGYAQAGQYLYVVGGYDATGGFETNVSASQRYDLTSDTWTSGPDLATPRADLALAATDTALYAIGGDLSGGGIFEASAVVERLESAGWPAGAWSGFAPLSLPLTANSAGFCTEAFQGGEVWSAGGADTSTFVLTGLNLFTATPGESCPSIRADVPWLTVDPTSGSVPGDDSVLVTVGVNTAGLAAGEYVATLLVSTTDPGSPEVAIPVRLTVIEVGVTLIAVANAGRVGGVAARNEDLLTVTTVGPLHAVSMYFDGSDVGLASFAIDAAARLDDGSILLSFTAAGPIPGISGTIDDSDIVRFVPTSIGANTAGTFTRWFDGSDVGLTTSNEDVDAIDVVGSVLYVSIVGQGAIPGIGTVQDEDISAFAWTSLGGTTAGTWTRFADMSDVGLSASSEDVDALAIADSDIHLSTTGNLSVPGLTAQDDDVVKFTIATTGSNTTGTWSATPTLDGASLGIGANDITAVDLP